MRKNYLWLLSLLMALIPVTAGASLTLPYENPCTDLKTLAGTTPNGTQKWNVYQSAFRVSRVNASTQSDASVFFPEVDFKAGYLYRISADLKVQYNRTPAGIGRIFLATATGEEGSLTFTYDGDALATYSDLSTTYVTKTIDYIPTENKTRYVAVNNNAPGACGIFYMKNFSIYEYNLTAPDAVTNLTVTPDATGRKQATVSFTAPTKTFGGEALTGTIGVKVVCNSTQINDVKNITPGQQVTFTQDFPATGTYTVQVIAYNDNGDGNDASVSATIGAGSTKPTWSSDYTDGYRYKIPVVYADGKATISWPATTGDNVTYKVVRQPDGKVIAESTTDTKAVDSDFITDAPVLYYYVVTATVDSETTSVGNSAYIGLNNAAPYEVVFNVEEAINEFTVLDSDKCNTHWSYNAGYKTLSTYDRDEWLITPGVKLEAGKYYRLSLDTWTSFSPVAVEAKLGVSNTAEAMTTEVIPFYWEKKTAATNHVNYFKVEANGNYFIGVHGCNPDDPKSYNYLRLSSMGVVEVSSQLPGAVENAYVKFNSQNKSQASIVFTASPKGISGEDLKSLTQIIVYREGEKYATIENPVPGNEYSVEVTVTSGSSAEYTIVPVNAEGEGVSTDITVSFIEPPYSQTFDDETATNGYTIIDGDNDGFTWHVYSGAARAYSNSSHKFDEWLITPPVHLEGGKYYKTYFTTYLSSDPANSNYYNIISLSLGNEPTAEAMTKAVIEPYTITTSKTSSVLLKDYFTVAETGEYYLGFNAKSPETGTNNNPVFMDNFNISASIDPGVPGPATNLTITPNKMGELNGVIRFNAPSVTISGETLTSITKIVIYRDGTAVSQKATATTPGDIVEYNDTLDAEGIHLYTIVCYNANGEGREAEDVAYFGINSPSAPTDVVATETVDKLGEVTVTWNTPTTDANGFPINPDLIYYEVFEYDSSLDDPEALIATELNGNSYTFTALQSTDAQAFKRYGVRARTSKGGSAGALARYISVGQPYTLPLIESFPGYSPKVIFRQETVDGNWFASWGYNSVDPTGVEPVDGDEGLALMEAVFSGGSAGLITGKITLNVEHPILTFFVYNPESTTANGNYLNIQITPFEDINWKIIADQKIISWAQDLNGWQKVQVDLKDYAGKTVYLAFVAEAITHQYTLMDRINLRDATEQDMGVVTISTPERASAGSDYNVKVAVKHKGIASKSGEYTITVYRDDQAIATRTSKDLESWDIDEFVVTDNLGVGSIVGGSQIVTYYATVTVDGDGDLFDNTSAYSQTAVVVGSYPLVNDLTATAVDGTGEATVAWTAPTIPTSATRITDDVESYTSWSTKNDVVGDWKMVDADGLEVAGIVNITMPNVELQSKQAFFVMDFSLQDFVDFNKQAVESGDVVRYAAHSGTKVFATISPYYGSSYTSDDWLISPELTGEAQTVSFFAKSIYYTYPESFQVLYSTTGTATSDFKNLATVARLAGTGATDTAYTEFSYELPEGTKYFAIRHITTGGFLFLVDDITFTPAGNERLVVEGYNVYRNGEQIAKGIKQSSFADKELPTGTQDYGVSVQYNLGESPINTVSVYTSEVSSLLADTLRIYGAQKAIKVVNAQGVDIEVYATDGRLLNRVEGEAVTTIPAIPGIYIVRAGDVTQKVSVN